jgi:hypothetical protein
MLPALTQNKIAEELGWEGDKLRSAADPTRRATAVPSLSFAIDICHGGIGDIYLNHYRLGLVVGRKASDGLNEHPPWHCLS